MERATLNKANKYAFILLVLLTAYSYFVKDNYRKVDDLHPDVFQEPVQTEAADKTVSRFSRDGFDYEITPRYDYVLNALIVGRKDYRRFSISRTDNLYPLDLCVLWGENVERKLFQSKSLYFRQSSRQSNWFWLGDLGFRNDQAANIHLMAEDDAIQWKLDKLGVGDQVKLTGQLVDVKGRRKGEGKYYEPSDIQLETSTVRNDEGPGACEIISVKEVETLKKAAIWQKSLFIVSFPLLLLLAGANVLRFGAYLFAK